MSVKERQEFVTKNRLCRGCLKWGHVKSNCHKKMLCTFCNGKHPTLLHDDIFMKVQKTQESKAEKGEEENRGSVTPGWNRHSYIRLHVR